MQHLLQSSGWNLKKNARVEDENRRLLSSFKKKTNYLTRQIFPKLSEREDLND